jgi:hypothetical protein
MIIDDVMTDKITLHGLGFVQVQLQGEQRLHVWHPELPRRACFEHSAIHDHRFNFASRVIIGSQINHCYQMSRSEDGEFVLYLHEGARTAGGGRPWTPDGRASFEHDGTLVIAAGDVYTTRAYEYHRTEPGGDGKVATIRPEPTQPAATACSQTRTSTAISGRQPSFGKLSATCCWASG